MPPLKRVSLATTIMRTSRRPSSPFGSILKKSTNPLVIAEARILATLEILLLTPLEILNSTSNSARIPE